MSASLGSKPISLMAANCSGNCPITYSKKHVSQGFEDWDLFQVGGIIFF